MSAWASYDAWLTDYGRCGAPEEYPRCHCCDEEVTTVDEGDEDGRYRHVPELCDECDHAGCRGGVSACVCVCGASGAVRGRCEDCEWLLESSALWLRAAAMTSERKAA